MGKTTAKNPLQYANHCQGSVEDTVIQATGTLVFEDGLKKGTSLQRVCTIPKTNATIYSRGRVYKVPPWADMFQILLSSAQSMVLMFSF